MLAVLFGCAICHCKQRCIQQIWDVSCELLNSCDAVILELGLVQLADREDFYRRVDGTDYELQVHLVDTPLEVRRQRVRDRNAQKRGTYFLTLSRPMIRKIIG